MSLLVFAIILMGKRELVALLGVSSWCLVTVVWLFLAVPWVCLQVVIVVFPDHTRLLFYISFMNLQNDSHGMSNRINTFMNICRLQWLM